MTDTVGSQKLSEGEEQIASGEARLATGEAKYQAGAAQLSDAKAQYAAGKAELEAGKAAYAEGQAKLEAAKAEYAAGQEQLQRVKPIYDMVNPMYQNYLAIKTQYDNAVATGDTETAQRLEATVNAQKAAFESQLMGTGYSIASLIQSYQEGQAKLSEGAAQIAEGEQQLREAEQQLADGQAKLDAAAGQIAAGEQELNSGKAQLDNGRAQLNAAKGELAAGRETLDENRAALADDLENLDAYADDAERLQAGMERLMQEEGISARAGKDATNAAVISAARQEVRAAQDTIELEAGRKTVQSILLTLSGLIGLIALILMAQRNRVGFALLIAAFPPALAAVLICAPSIAPIAFGAALALLAALAFGALAYRKIFAS